MSVIQFDKTRRNTPRLPGPKKGTSQPIPTRQTKPAPRGGYWPDGDGNGPRAA